VRRIITVITLLALALSPGFAFAQVPGGAAKFHKSEQEFKDAMAGLNFVKARAQANRDIRAAYGLKRDHHNNESEHGNYDANPDMWKGRYVFTYGQQHDFDQGHHRYLGYTFNEEKYTNALFRHDAWAGGWFTSRNWIERPWSNSDVERFLLQRGESALKRNEFNQMNPGTAGFKDLSESALIGILVYSDFSEAAPFPDFVTLHDGWLKIFTDLGFRHTEAAQIIGRLGESELAANLAKYIHVLDPPTSVSFGMGRMFHQLADGRIFYLTIPLFPTSFKLPEPPPRPDFSVELIPGRFDGQDGQKLTGTVRYALNEDHPQPETAILRLHHVAGGEHAVRFEALNPADAPDAQGHVAFQPGDVKEYRYSFTVQAASEMILARINPVQGQDKNWANNRAEAPILRPCTDIRVSLTPHPAGVRGTGDNTQLTAVVTRGRDGPAGPVSVRFKFGHGSWQNFTLAQGQSREFRSVVTHDQAGNITYSAEAWPVGIEDCNPANNRASVTIPVQARPEFAAGESKTWGELIP
jgi:hypothetical protein